MWYVFIISRERYPFGIRHYLYFKYNIYFMFLFSIPILIRFQIVFDWKCFVVWDASNLDVHMQLLYIFAPNLQKQPSISVLTKRSSENMQQIFRRTPMLKCDFNNVALQLYWNRTSVWVFPCKYFQNLFLRTPLDGCFCPNLSNVSIFLQV